MKYKDNTKRVGLEMETEWLFSVKIFVKFITI